jgi:hypothetical protein
MTQRYHTEFRVDGPMSNRQGYYYIIDSATGKELPNRYIGYEVAHRVLDKLNGGAESQSAGGAKR